MESDRRKIINILAEAVKLGVESLPDSEKWEYCWGECTGEEQERVKEIAALMNKALMALEEFNRKRN